MRSAKCSACKKECKLGFTGLEARNDRLMPCGRPEGCMWIYAVTSRAKRIILREIETVVSMFDIGTDDNRNLMEAHKLIREGAEKLNLQALNWLWRVNERMTELKRENANTKKGETKNGND